MKFRPGASNSRRRRKRIRHSPGVVRTAEVTAHRPLSSVTDPGPPMPAQVQEGAQLTVGVPGHRSRSPRPICTVRNPPGPATSAERMARNHSDSKIAACSALKMPGVDVVTAAQRRDQAAAGSSTSPQPLPGRREPQRIEQGRSDGRWRRRRPVSARISPTTGTNLNPCPEKPHATITCSCRDAAR